MNRSGITRRMLHVCLSFVVAFVVAVICNITELSAADGVAIDESNFPDEVFRTYVSTNFDSDKDGALSETELQNVKMVDVKAAGVADLKGIEYFTNLQGLYCQENSELSSIDVSGNAKLMYFNCANTGITELDVSNNTELTSLNCYKTMITELDVSKNTNLVEFTCGHTGVTEIDVSGSVNLTYLNCEYSKITSLDISNNLLLERLFLEGTGIESIDISKHVALTAFSCNNTKITELDVSNNVALKQLHCGDTGITSLDISKNVLLECLGCWRTNITELDVSKNEALVELSCFNCKLSCLDVSNNTALNVFRASGNTCDIGSVGCCYNLSNLKGFDVSKASDWTGVTYKDGKLTDYEDKYIQYKYDCGNGNIVEFKLTYTYDGSHNIVDGVCSECGEIFVDINETNFPDEVFRTYVSANFDSDKDGMLSPDEINSITVIRVSGTSTKDGGITSLKGIEHFAQLEKLVCEYNTALTSIDLSNNTKLGYLDCYNTGITSLDVSNNPALWCLNCADTEITSLDVSNNVKLQKLRCYSNGITELNVSQNVKLELLYCSNTDIASLDLSNNTALEWLSCNRTDITSLDVSNNNSLTYLDCSTTGLSVLDVSNNTALENLNCNNVKITSLNLSKNTALTELACANTGITSLDISSNTALVKLYCENNSNLSGIDVRGNTALEILSCYKTGVACLDLSNNTALTFVNCSNTGITSLDVSNNTALQRLICSNTGVTSLDLSKNTALQALTAGGNEFNIGKVSSYNLSSLAGFDVTKASEWMGATYSEGWLSDFVSEHGEILVTYSYDCGNDFYATFTLVGELAGEMGEDEVEISFDKSEVTITDARAVGKMVYYEISPSDADVKLVVSSSDETVATSYISLTSYNGEYIVISPVNDGTAVITLSTEDGSASVSCTVTVDIATYGYVDYSAVYDYEYYTEKYPELIGSMGTAKALKYFVENGMALGHQASEEFNLVAYKSNYPDLGVAFGSDNVKYYEHYISNGKAEGRNATVVLVESDTKYYGVEYADVYNYDYYINNNPDLKAAFGDNKAAALIHFANMGMKEGRQACENFGAKIYKFNYPELQESFGEDMTLYYHHYIEYGKAEGRNGATRDFSAYCVYEGVNYTPVYNYEDYIERNPDVFNAYGLDANAVLKHFVTVGMAEGRQGSDDFNYNIYRSNYPDLEVAFGEDRAQYYHHYINSGYNEGRNAATSDYTSDTVYAGVDYAAVYSYDYYVTANPDVAAAIGDNKIAILAHFVRNGMAEGRQGSAEFNVRVYMEKNPDLAEEFGDDLKAYYMHYMEEGKEAGREAV